MVARKQHHWFGSKLGNWFHNGFKVGPNHVAPPAPVAEDWIESYDERVQHDLPCYSHWWTVFNDPTLDMLINQTYGANLTLRAAGTRVLQARAIRRIAAGNIFPQFQQMSADYIRTQHSQTLPGGAGPLVSDFWSTGFELAWELDIWGKFRREIESADANIDASIASYDDILVLLLAETAATYVEYRTLQERLSLTEANIEIQQGSFEIAEAKFRGDFVSKLDVTQAQTNLERTKAVLPRLNISLRNAMLRLCVLTGQPPQDLSELLDTGQIPQAPATVAVGIPADLLRRRPDLRLAEREVALQSAQIGVAVADLFPHFSINGFLGWESEKLSNLFNSNSFAGFINAPSMRWNLLNYARLLNNVQLQDARFQELVLNYQQKVLEAGEEAEQAINGFLRSQEETEFLVKAVTANEESVSLAATQYQDGFIDFNRVFTLQGDLVVSQDQLAIAQGNIALNLIAIYKSLGGGWQIRCRPAFTQVAPSSEIVPTPEDSNISPPTDEAVPSSETLPAPLDPDISLQIPFSSK